MNGKFKLEIELGNESMQTKSDVRFALAQVSYAASMRSDDAGVIRDTNGNTVGWWRYEKPNQNKAR